MCRSCVLYMGYNGQYASFFRTLNALVAPFKRS